MIRFGRTQMQFAPLALALLVAAACAGEPETAGEEAEQEAQPEQEAAAVAAYSAVEVIPEMRTPESVRVGADDRYYVSQIGGFGEDGDGRIVALDPETWEATVYADGLNDPKGTAFVGDVLYVTDRDRIVGVAADGQISELVTADAFPESPSFLNDLVQGPDGALYVSDSGAFDAADGAIYRVDMDGNVEPVITIDDSPEIAAPNGVAFDRMGTLYTVDLNTGKLLRVPDGRVEVVAEGFGGGDGLEFAPDGTLYVSDFQNGRVFRVTFDAEGANVEQVAELEGPAADIGLDVDRGRLLVPQLDANTVTVLRLP